MTDSDNSKRTATMQHLWRPWLPRLSCLLFCVAMLPHARADATLAVYVVPQFSSEEIFNAWTPVLKKISEKTGLIFTLKIAKSIPEFEQLFTDGVPDVAFLNPYHAVMAKRAAGYVPIICDAHQKLSGILVVRRDSPLTKVTQLSEKDIAFPAPNSFGASLYMRALLQEHEHINFTPHYVSTHSNVFRQVLAGLVVAGGAVRQTLEKESTDLQGQLRILYETPEVISHPVVVHPRVNAAIRLKLQNAFLELGSNPDTAQMLRQIQLPKPRKVTYSDYAPLEQLGLEKYVVNPSKK